MAAMEIKPGDTVRLKSGGPIMTVNWIDKEYGVTVWCDWFIENQPKKERFPPTSLELVEMGKS